MENIYPNTKIQKCYFGYLDTTAYPIDYEQEGASIFIIGYSNFVRKCDPI